VLTIQWGLAPYLHPGRVVVGALADGAQRLLRQRRAAAPHTTCASDRFETPFLPEELCAQGHRVHRLQRYMRAACCVPAPALRHGATLAGDTALNAQAAVRDELVQAVQRRLHQPRLKTNGGCQLDRAAGEAPPWWSFELGVVRDGSRLRGVAREQQRRQQHGGVVQRQRLLRLLRLQQHGGVVQRQRLRRRRLLLRAARPRGAAGQKARGGSLERRYQRGQPRETL
jgi:hypothetical protein